MWRFQMRFILETVLQFLKQGNTDGLFHFLNKDMDYSIDEANALVIKCQEYQSTIDATLNQ